MNKTLRFFSGVLAFALLFSLCGCGKQPSQTASATVEGAAEQPVATENPLPTAQALGPVSYQSPCIDAPYDYEYYAADKQIVIRRFQTNGITYFIADVQLSDASQFKTALSENKPSGKLETVSTIATRNGAVLAINADDYGVHKYGTIIRNGELIRTHDTTRNMLIVDASGDFSVRVDRKNENPAQLGQELLNAGVRQTFEFGPELIRDGQAVAFSPDFDVISTNANRREPRTAIGQIGPLHYVIVVADGRQNGYSIGMTLPELQQIFILCGAKTAMNLDGGGSAEMWFGGEIINQPSGGEERRLSDILYF